MNLGELKCTIFGPKILLKSVTWLFCWCSNWSITCENWQTVFIKVCKGFILELYAMSCRNWVSKILSNSSSPSDDKKLVIALTLDEYPNQHCLCVRYHPDKQGMIVRSSWVGPMSIDVSEQMVPNRNIEERVCIWCWEIYYPTGNDWRMLQLHHRYSKQIDECTACTSSKGQWG